MDFLLIGVGLAIVYGVTLFFIDRYNKKPSVIEAIRRQKEAETRQAEEKLEKEKRVQTELLSIVKHHLGGETYKTFGVAYWDTIGSKVGSAFDKVMASALLGGIGMQMTGKTHHIGLVAVTETNLHIIETGTLVGEQIERSSELLPTSGQGVSKSFPLKGLVASVESGNLTISGIIDMKMVFPVYPDSQDNPSKGKEIAQEIEAGK